MRFLSLSDRKEAALVCRGWYEASLDPILQQDIIIHFYASLAALSSSSIPSLSRRRLPHLVLNNFDTSLDAKSVVVKSCEHLAANLKSLSLKGSNITERTFVEFLSQCKNLQSLDLSCCNSLFMSGQILEKNSDIQVLKGALEKVTEVNLSSIRFLSDAVFNRIMTVCENVEKLSLASVQITFYSKGVYYPREQTRCANGSVLTFNNIFDFFLTQQCLTSLNFTRTQIEDEHIEAIVSIPELHLQELIFVRCRNISDKGIASICRYQTGLITLDLRECPDLTNGAVMAVGSFLKQLKNLYLHKCKMISDKSVAVLDNLNHLEVLDLSECFQITSTGLIKGLCAGNTTNLTHLSLNCCSSVNDLFVLKACESLPFLVHLDLGSCFPVTDLSVHAISRSLKYLRYLRLAWCKNITDLGLLGLHAGEEHINHGDHDDSGMCKCNRKYQSTTVFRKPTAAPKSSSSSGNLKQLSTEVSAVNLSNLAGLRYLDLTACKKLTDTGLMQTIKFPELRNLHLGLIPGLTDEGLIDIIKKCPSIEELNVSQNATLTDDVIETVVKKLHRLQTLNVFGCDKLTDRSVQLIQAHCDRLKNLDVSFCSGISLMAMENLETQMKTLVNVQKRMIGIA